MSWGVIPAYDPTINDSGNIYVVTPNELKGNFVFVVPPTTAQGVITVVQAESAATDQGSITIQSITQTYFQTNIKKFIPYEYWRLDALSVEEGGGEGALEDLTEVYAVSLDEIKQAVDEFPLLFDIDHCPPKYLRVIAEMLAYPLEEVDSTAEQRRQLKEAINWYKTKGSRKGFLAMLYAFGFYAELIPLWTEHAAEADADLELDPGTSNLYEIFTDTIPGVARGNDPPNDHPKLIENGGTWFRSPHFGIRLKGIVGDRHVDIDWGTLTENEIPIVDDIVDTTPDAVETSFGGFTAYYPVIAGTVSGNSWTPDDPPGTTVTFTDDGLGVLGGTGVAGTIDYDTGAWTLVFDTPPTDEAEIKMSYSFDFEPVIREYGKHAAYYRYVDEITNAGALLHYFFDEDAFAYMWRRLEFMRPVFAVLDWLELQFEMQEKYVVPEAENPVMIVNPTREEKGWYLGYCDMDDIVYTRYDARLLGPDLDIDNPLTALTPGTIAISDEVTLLSVPGPAEYDITGTLVNPWVFGGTVVFTVTIGAVPVDVADNGEGVLGGTGVEGFIDYVTGEWQLLFDPTPPDDASSIVVDYVYVEDVPPCDRSGVIPRGSAALPFAHLRDPQPGYCHPPEELDVDWYWIQPEQYMLPLTRNGLVYLPAGPVPYIDHSDFPSRGFTDGLGNPGHANTFTRELGYADRPLSLLRVQENPPDDAENWENQNTSWELWTGPWENIGD